MKGGSSAQGENKKARHSGNERWAKKMCKHKIFLNPSSVPEGVLNTMLAGLLAYGAVGANHSCGSASDLNRVPIFIPVLRTGTPTSI
jgi:hypothetical protein